MYLLETAQRTLACPCADDVRVPFLAKEETMISVPEIADFRLH